nr:centromere protein Q isoform X2 [Taeniopygia guttata]
MDRDKDKERDRDGVRDGILPLPHRPLRQRAAPAHARWAGAALRMRRGKRGFVLQRPGGLRRGRQRREGLQIRKPRHASSNEMGKPSGGRSAKSPLKSQNQQGPSSKKKGADKQGRKRSKKRQVPQTDKRKVKDLKDYSPAGENGSSKKVKLSSATIRSWQPLSENSRQFLENTVDSVVLSVLSQQTEEKDDVQKHLNVLKNRVLRSFKTLTVPPGKLGNLKNILGLQMAEKQMLETNEESLVQLQEEITEAERSAELIEENIQQLQYKIQVLKNQLKKDEENARKVFQENGSGALQLPELPKCSFQAPTLQEEILKVKNQKGLLKDMNAIQQSANLKNLLTLIEKTYEKVDLL